MSAVGVLGRTVGSGLVLLVSALYERPAYDAAVDFDIGIGLDVSVLTAAIYVAVDIRIVKFFGVSASVACLSACADSDICIVNELHAGDIVASAGRHTASGTKYVTVVDTFLARCCVAHGSTCDRQSHLTGVWCEHTCQVIDITFVRIIDDIVNQVSVFIHDLIVHMLAVGLGLDSAD